MSISRGNVPFLGRFPRLIDTFLLTAEDFLLTKLQVGPPVEYEKQLEQLLQLVTTLSISHGQNRARSGYAMARKGTMKWNLHAFACITILLQGKQQNTRLRGDITPGQISWKCVQGEALFIVVSLAASFELHGPRRGDVLAKRCVLL